MASFLAPWPGSPSGQNFSTNKFPNVIGKIIEGDNEKQLVLFLVLFCIAEYYYWSTKLRRYFKNRVVQSASLLELTGGRIDISSTHLKSEISTASFQCLTTLKSLGDVSFGVCAQLKSSQNYMLLHVQLHTAPCPAEQ